MPRARKFFADYAGHTASRGQLRIFHIAIAGNVVATRIGFVFGRDLYLYYTSYDPAWGKYSIMTTVTAKAIKCAIQHGLKIVNLSTGNDVIQDSMETE
jgi:CelD/BcsL family acetyltransferase involved in cellulose biosynthesis